VARGPQAVSDSHIHLKEFEIELALRPGESWLGEKDDGRGEQQGVCNQSFLAEIDDVFLERISTDVEVENTDRIKITPCDSTSQPDF